MLPLVITSPDGAVRVTVGLDSEGTPWYSVDYGATVVLHPSRLGLQLAEADCSRGLAVADVGEPAVVEDAYTLRNDKRTACRYRAHRRIIRFSDPNGLDMSVVFQVSDDGVAFRYRLAGGSDAVYHLLAEQTTFRLPAAARGWLHPHAVAQSGWANTQPSYEEYYQMGIAAGTPSPLGQGWSWPALFEVGGHWLLLTETDLDRHYCGTHLRHLAPAGEYGVALAQEPERTTPTAPALPESRLPWRTPWRVLVVGATLGPLVESTLTTDLSTPARPDQAAVSPPGPAAWSWALLRDPATVFEVQQRFIDYAAAMRWPYCLIDALWDTQIGYDQVAELARYARTQHVGLLLWYNSNGTWNHAPQTPRHRLNDAPTRRQEFARLQRMGIRGVKIDFFGGDGQSMIGYYHDLLADAAAAGLLVNFHGSTIPRGWTRTYPHLLTMEAVRGFEYLTFEQANADQAPLHCAVLPFTRNAVGPMDFTPVCFSEIPGIRRVTTNGFELALAVLFQSGIQHYAEVPDGMARQPAYVVDFIRHLPPHWDEVKFLAGFPGQYVVLARRAQGQWYVAGINGTAAEKTVTLDFAALGASGSGTLITDGHTTRDFSTHRITGATLTLSIQAHGGFVLQLDRTYALGQETPLAHIFSLRNTAV